MYKISIPIYNFTYRAFTYYRNDIAGGLPNQLFRYSRTSSSNFSSESVKYNKVLTGRMRCFDSVVKNLKMTCFKYENLTSSKTIGPDMLDFFKLNGNVL